MLSVCLIRIVRLIPSVRILSDLRMVRYDAGQYRQPTTFSERTVLRRVSRLIVGLPFCFAVGERWLAYHCQYQSFMSLLPGRTICNVNCCLYLANVSFVFSVQDFKRFGVELCFTYQLRFEPFATVHKCLKTVVRSMWNRSLGFIGLENSCDLVPSSVIEIPPFLC